MDEDHCSDGNDEHANEAFGFIIIEGDLPERTTATTVNNTGTGHILFSRMKYYRANGL